MTKHLTLGRDGSTEMSTRKMVLILIAVIGGAIAALVVFLSYITPEMGDATVSGHGTVAMILGVVFSLIVGIGLMGLVFYSSRRGYDEGVVRHRDSDTGPDAEIDR